MKKISLFVRTAVVFSMGLALLSFSTGLAGQGRTRAELGGGLFSLIISGEDNPFFFAGCLNAGMVDKHLGLEANLLITSAGVAMIGNFFFCTNTTAPLSFTAQLGALTPLSEAAFLPVGGFGFRVRAGQKTFVVARLWFPLLFGLTDEVFAVDLGFRYRF